MVRLQFCTNYKGNQHGKHLKSMHKLIAQELPEDRSAEAQSLWPRGEQQVHSLVAGEPAVHHQVVPGHVLGVVGGEVHGGLGHVHRLARRALELAKASNDVSHLLLVGGALHHCGELAHHHRRRHGVRRDAVDPHAEAAQLRGGGLDDPGDGELGHGVRIGPEPSDHTADAGHADDGAAGRHGARRVLDPGERPAYVHGHDGFERGQVEAGDLSGAGGERSHDAGAVEHDVQPAVPRHGGVHGRRDAVLHGHVAVDEVGLGSQLLGRFQAELGVYVREDHGLRALLDELVGRGLAEPTRSTGY
jgi:hypothetical protein